MNKPILYGAKVCFGAKDEWATRPINNLPPDTIKVRRRIRNTEIARAYVKTPTEVQEWILAPDGDFKTCIALKLLHRKGTNVRPPNESKLSHGGGES